MRRILFLILALAILQTNSQNTFNVNAGNYYYSPSSLTIELGDVVNWYNDSGFHNVNFDINSITYESFGNPESFSSSATSSVGALIYSHQFDIPGTYTYDCSIGNHAANGMVGTIIVSQPNECAEFTIDSNNYTILEDNFGVLSANNVILVPVHVSSQIELESYQFNIVYDPTVIQLATEIISSVNNTVFSSLYNISPSLSNPSDGGFLAANTFAIILLMLFQQLLSHHQLIK